ncbi:LamG domain-containing protein [Nonomuraea sp. NPDC003560]|uniref:LamG domain-containing protein n=1 Tax=Nonomuraea sp. NPDC003560 TaxID=3364341 RepID=UPI0036BCBF94
MVATEAAALKLARKTGKPVEIGAFRGESREVFANSDGTYTAVEHLRPVRTHQAGRWVRTDARLEKKPDGSIGPVASTVELRFSTGGDAPLAAMGLAGRELSLGWNNTLPAPTLDGDTAVYADVLPGVDLRARADVDGFSHVLVVKTREAAANPALSQLSYSLSGKGLTTRKDDTGAVSAVDTASGAVVFRAPTPLMWDSAPAQAATARTLKSAPAAAPGQVSSAEGPGEGANVAELGVQVTQDELALVPDQSLLTGANTTFPVYIDPVFKTEQANEWAMTTSAFPSTPYYKFKGKNDEGMGYCSTSLDSRCGSNHVKRLHYEMPIGAYAGKTVISAEFQAKEVWSASCEDRSVQLWWTDNFADALDWDKQKTSGWWRQQLDSRDVAYGHDANCPAKNVEFDAKAGLTKALAAGQSRMAFGLRAANESDMIGWKRFGDDAYLRVNYNTPPQQPKPADLSMNPGGACVSPNGPKLQKVPVLYATLRDADTEDAAKVRGQFRLFWDGALKWTSPLTDAKASGSQFQMTIPATLNPPQGKTLSWDARSYDGTTYSAYSSEGTGAVFCTFLYDTAAPTAPTITSTSYPESDPDNPDDPWIDGVGRYGDFTISTTATDVVKYQIGLNTDPSSAFERTTTGGGPVTVSIMPSTAGVNFLRVKALDAAGNASAVAQYLFRVKAGTPAKAEWNMDDPAGSTTLSGQIPATLTGNATLGIPGADGTALDLDGTSTYAKTAGPALDTTKSFSIAAWVRLATSKPGKQMNVMAQAGAVKSGFDLFYSPGYDRWSFMRTTTDTSTATGVRVNSTAAPQGGEWQHLVGVYDATAGQLRLYVNGTLTESTAFTSGWNATGAVFIGSGAYSGGPGTLFGGSIDDVRLYDRVVTGTEARDLFTTHPTVAARWKLNSASGTPAVSGDDSGKARNLTLGGGASISTANVAVGTGALTLNGTSGYAATAAPVVNTGESFTVATWASTAGRPQKPVAVLSEEGNVNSAFTLRYVPDRADPANQGAWQIDVPDKDATGAVSQTASHPRFQTNSTWDHLAVVYDAFADQLRLYVNGQLEESVSVRDNTVAFSAAKGLQLGRTKTGGAYGEYWPGQLDDTWAFTGIASESQIQTLANSTEITTYPPTAPELLLTFDECDGTTVYDYSGKGHDATLNGTASWVEDVRGSCAAQLTGGAYASSTSPVRTDRAFSVTAWVKLDSATANHAAVSQDSAGGSAFYLGYEQATQRWMMRIRANDTSTAAARTALSSAAPAIGTWTHLAGVYDPTSKKISLYVNGVLQGSAAHDTPWNGSGALQIGRTKFVSGSYGNAFPGALDEVHAYQGALTAEEITLLANS